ncbi:MAG: TrkA family potassium uptake protein [Spirochaetaceae bacterium]|jgi:trk system potassium uptake protein TrkA|nr:TrkA family potassium uptake protein [Spirochaetaceae bacterium]
MKQIAKQIAILGLGHFGKSVLEELLELNTEVLVIDKDRDLIDVYKDAPVHAAVADILSFETLRKILPESVDAVVIDTGERIEASILAASYCAKMRVKIIIAKAETESHAEILELVGATKVIFPNREAAQRVTRQIFSASLLNYLPVGNNVVIAEMAVPPDMVGKMLAGSGLRENYGLNLLAVRSGGGEFLHCAPDYLFKENDIGLFSGNEENINRFTQKPPDVERQSVVAKLFKLGASRISTLFHSKKPAGGGGT